MDQKTWRKNLRHKFVKIDKNRTSIYVDSSQNKPFAVLFHGFGGNYFGLTPLAFELSKKFSIIICELPAHGKNSLEVFENISEFKEFYRNLIAKIQADFGEISLIVAHSFSCFFAAEDQISAKIPTVLINPVYSPSRSFLNGMRISNAFKLVMILSNLPIFSPPKALALQKIWTREATKNVFENIFHCQNSPRKLLTQQKLIPIALSGEAFRGKNPASLVIVGRNDGTVAKFDERDFRKFFPDSKFKVLNGGHLLPMERPKKIAKVIFENIEK